MLTAIKGYYEQGQVFLQEEAPVTAKTDVIITFLSDEQRVDIIGKKRIPGGLKGKVTIQDDFNEPLEDMKDYI